jgi:hypothetical protein
MAQMVQPLFGAIALPGCVHKGEVYRFSSFQEPLLQGYGDLLSKSDSHKATCCHRIPISDDTNSFFCGHNFSSLCASCRKGGKQWMAAFHVSFCLVHETPPFLTLRRANQGLSSPY